MKATVVLGGGTRRPLSIVGQNSTSLGGDAVVPPSVFWVRVAGVRPPERHSACHWENGGAWMCGGGGTASVLNTVRTVPAASDLVPVSVTSSLFSAARAGVKCLFLHGSSELSVLWTPPSGRAFRCSVPLLGNNSYAGSWSRFGSCEAAEPTALRPGTPPWAGVGFQSGTGPVILEAPLPLAPQGGSCPSL